MKKEEIYDLLNRLDLQEWCTELYEVPLTWCELYDIRDYLINLEQQCKEQQQAIDKAIEYIKKAQLGEFPTGVIYWLKDDEVGKKLLQILEDKGVEDNGN